MTPDCQSCQNKYMADDRIYRCRPASGSIACSPAAADGCKSYEPGTDADESPWYAGGWCVDQGRGD